MNIFTKPGQAMGQTAVTPNVYGKGGKPYMNFAAFLVGLAAVITLGYYLIPAFSPKLAERLKIAEAEKAPSDSETER
ncbi:hypothetical protein SAMN04489735_1004157 [Aneurinibacillus thermoaerophilus]|jgi:hypothetical protein|uniref:Uncharacterized protein n=2 Tax=Aneurinibacillus thermoaerophilus TaxID=143495 RepID=A0A1G7XSG0_ANETH|nr:hypothetical protein SAMN04489735_1004157 [Aneurinibacillus thermoaerophilus]